MGHDRNKHYARCDFCGWIGKESELPDGEHQCGEDKCPDCGKENGINCCYPTYEDARQGTNCEA